MGKSRRLDQHTRDQVNHLLLRHRFEEDVLKIVARRARIADQLYKLAFPARVREQINALPESWLPTKNNIKAQISGEIISVPFSGAVISLLSQVISTGAKPDEEWRRFPYKSVNSVTAVYDASDRITEEWWQLSSDQTDLKEAIERAQVQARQSLAAYNTTKQLEEGWPEVKPFLHRVLPPERPKLPALPIDTLNATFELPEKETA